MLTALEVLLSLGRYQFMKDVIQVSEEWQGLKLILLITMELRIEMTQN